MFRLRREREKSDDIFSPENVGWQNIQGWDSDRGDVLINGTISLTIDFLELLIKEWEADNPQVVDTYAKQDAVKLNFSLREPKSNSFDYSGNIYVAKPKEGSSRRKRRRRDEEDNEEPPKKSRSQRASKQGGREEKPASRQSRTTSRTGSQKTTETGSGSKKLRNGSGGTSRSEGKATGTRSASSKTSRTEERRTRPRQ